MMIRLLSIFCTLPLAALAEVPRVVTDIAPIHSLTAQVMGDLGTPDLLLPPGTNPHHFALRPSDADRLSNADLIIWVGDGLTPWLVEPFQTLAPQAAQLSLLDAADWTPLEVREYPEGDHDDHGDEHEDEHEDEHNHDHGDVDPHAWLDPAVAAIWIGVIATTLAEADPENASVYVDNAIAARTKLDALQQDLATQLADLTQRPYVLPHDGYQYFEARFGFTAQAAIAGIDARTPGPAQVAALRDQMAVRGIVCVFSDAEVGDRWAALITEGTDARSAAIDGIGQGLDAGPQLYEQMVRRLAGAFSDCLRDGS